MSNYGRDVLWDAATWADLDQAVSDEVNRVRVARKIFRTEDVSSATGAAPFWVSVAEITQLSMPETKARPFVDISVPFWLTVGQAEAEDTLHTGRTLARAAAKLLAMAEDHTIFRGGTPMPNAAVRTSNQNGLIGLAQQSGMQPRAVLPIAADNPADLHARPRSLLAKVNRGITDQTAAGWPGPYALILGAGLYTAASARLDPGSAETPADRLAPTLRHCLLSGALEPETGVLVSLAGDATTIYTASEASVTFSAEELHDRQGARYRFRVSERFQFAVTDRASITRFQG
jgi:uncharacterized linocin/CFP29 family protein